MARPTHRARIWRAPDTEPELVDLVLVDRDARGLGGELVARLGRDGEWYWISGVPPARWEIRGIGGRPPRAGVAATRQIPVRFPATASRPATRVNLKVTEAEEEIVRRMAKDAGLDLSSWVRKIAGGSPRCAARLVRLALQAAGLA